MTPDEFYARLKTVPITRKDLENFGEAMPPQLVHHLMEDEDRLLDALKDRLFDVRTAPQGRAWMEFSVGIGILLATGTVEEILREAGFTE